MIDGMIWRSLAFVNQIIDVSGESIFRFHTVIGACVKNGVILDY